MTNTSSDEALAGQSAEAVTLLITGEMNIQDRPNPVSAFAGIMSILRSADVLFGHLEGPFCPPSNDPSVPDIPHKDGWRHSDPHLVSALVAAGYDAVGCASNVSYPPRAALNSRRVLEEAGIAACGVGENLVEARRPAIVTRGGVRFGFLSYTSVFWPWGHAADASMPGVATLKATTAYQPGRRALEMPGAPPIVVTAVDPAELQAMEEDVRRLRTEVDVVVLSCHWGVSSSDRPMDYQRQIAHAAIDAGADLIIGHHPHVVQAVEFCQGRPIFYSLGNFVFDWPKMRGRHLDGLLVKIEVRSKAIVGVSFVPVRRNANNLVEPLDPGAGSGLQIVNRVRALSDHSVQITAEGSTVRVTSAQSPPSGITQRASTGQPSIATSIT